MIVHLDEHWLVRDLALQPEEPRITGDGKRTLQRISKRKTADGWESVDHMCAGALAACSRADVPHTQAYYQPARLAGGAGRARCASWLTAPKMTRTRMIPEAIPESGAEIGCVFAGRMLDDD